LTSATFTANRQRVDDASGVLQFLEISHPSFSAPVYIVNDTRDWVSNGRTYTGFPFRFTYPQDSDNEAPQSKLEIDNVGRDLMSELERLPATAVLNAVVRLADRSTPDVIEWSWSVPMSSVSANAALITARLSVDYLMRQQAVRLRHDPNTSPGLF
jgi:hypothetical protein